MKLEEFALATWLNQYETDIPFNLAASTGPLWRVGELLALEGRDPRELAETPLNYAHAAGTRELRAAVAQFYGNVSPEEVQITTGSAEALWLMLFEACEPGANVVVMHPCYPAFDAIPRALGAEVRYLRLRPENSFRPDPDELRHKADGQTRVVILNSPHNPTGIVVEPEEIEAIYLFCAERNIQFIADEVYHGIYHDGRERPSCARLPRATVTGDVSKAFSLAGLRIGWIVERDPARRHAYYNARSYVCASSNVLGERLAALALRNYRRVWERNRELAGRNLAALARLIEDFPEQIAWVQPKGGFTCFPWLKDGASATSLCRQLADENGVLFAPGEVFGMPAHIRIGFGVAGERFPEALERVRKIFAPTPTTVARAV